MILAEDTKIINLVGTPADLDGGFTSSYVSMKNYNHATFIINMGTTHGDACQVTMAQATAVAGTSTKTFSFTTVYKQQGAGSPHTTDTFTKTAITTATFSTTGAAFEMYVFEVDAIDLDVDNSFDCVNIKLHDCGTTYGGCMCILTQPRYVQGATTPITPRND